MYLYVSHLSDKPFITNEQMEWEYLYCEQCGDTDSFIGEYDTVGEIVKILLDMGYDIGLIEDIISEGGDLYV